MSSYPGILPGWLDFGGDKPHPEPLAFTAGDSLKWTRGFPEYPASDGWTLAYVLNNQSNRYAVASGDITADADVFDVAIPSTETKNWVPGYYLWVAVLTNTGTGQRVTGAAGRVIVQADILDATAPVDTRAHVEIALENVRITLSGRATDGVQEYKIGDRELRRYTIDELIKLEAYYATKVRQLRITRGEYVEPETVAFHAGWGILG